MDVVSQICTAPLAHSLSKQELRHFWGLLVGVMGCCGWGLAVEVWLRRKVRGALSAAHAFLQGTVITSLLMTVGSLVGVCRPSFGVAVGGVMVGAGSYWWWRRSAVGDVAKAKLGWSRWLTWDSLGHGVVIAAFGPLVLFLGTLLVIYPTPFSDTTSIWSFHGKALSCECLFSSHFITEKVWTGTHPEYPLFMPFMHAYFFTLMDSFRDDLVKIHQGLAFICVCWLIGQTLVTRMRSHVAAAFGLFLFIVIINAHNGGLIELPRVEIHTAIFATLVALALLTGDLNRLWLYGFGLATVKRESFVSVCVLVALIGGYMLLLQPHRVGLVERLRKARPYLLPFSPLALVLVLLLRLPSHHEQYEKVLFSASVWQRGLDSVQTIVVGCYQVLRQSPTWKPFLVLIPATVVGALGGYLWRRTAVSRMICGLVAWTCAMLVVLLGVYIVSPWGGGLYRITFERQLEQFLPPLIIALAASVAVLMNAPRRCVLGPLLGLVIVGYTGLSYRRIFAVEVNTRYEQWRAARSQHRIGILAFANTYPEWRQAIALDQQLPPASRGAMLGSVDYFTVNYLLYPRIIYPTEPHLVAGTMTSWTPWSEVSEEQMVKYGFQFRLRDIWHVVPR